MPTTVAEQTTSMRLIGKNAKLTFFQADHKHRVPLVVVERRVLEGLGLGNLDVELAE